MTKAELVSQISKKLGTDKLDTQRIIESFMHEVKKSLVNGENVYLRGFGTFLVKTRKEKKGRNITKNTTVIIPERNVPAFKPSKEFVNEVKK